MTNSSDVAFSPAVKAIQEARGSRAAFARRAEWPSRITPELAAFLAEIRSFYLGSPLFQVGSLRSSLPATR